MCYYKSKNTIKIDTDGYDYNKENYDVVLDCDTTCDCFEVHAEGEYSHEDKVYDINKSYGVDGYRGFWHGLDSFRFDKNDIDNIPDDYIIKVNELSEGEIYSILKSEFICKSEIYDDTYILPFEHWDVIYTPEKVVVENKSVNSYDVIHNQFTKEKFMKLCERVSNYNGGYNY